MSDPNNTVPLVGTVASDVLTGTNENDVIIGRDGNDEIDGGDGDDLIDAGKGDDNILGGNGHDVVDGGAGDDVIDGGKGRDTLIGGPGSDVLVDDGRLRLKVERVDGRDVHCVVEVGGTAKNNKGINLPGVEVSAPSLTEKDKEDLAWAIANEADYVALSFVRSASDVQR